jgi:AraC family transcriptional regulator of adaptative response/methylated-DNA-[protein]-cysteine methyltransferase
MKSAASNEDIFYRAYKNHDRLYEGIFFMAVKTTGIFCRPGCKARLPRRENVEFFSTTTEALEHGYRPCKRCQPLKLAGKEPEWVSKAFDLVKIQPEHRFSDSDLKKHGIAPARLRRWFKQQHGITFHAYQRQHKMNQAYDRIKQGSSVINSAFDSGFNSLSGFNESFQKITGFIPSSSRQQTVIAVTRLLTPLGPMLAAADDEGVCLLEFHDRKVLGKQIERVQNRLNVRLVPGEHELFRILQQQLDEYFNQQRNRFDVPLNLSGTAFQMEAWEALLTIPYGRTWSYQHQAEAIGNPQAIRAVARANAENALALLIPCHRVIAKSGGLAGYAGGIWRKQYLLKLERSE